MAKNFNYGQWSINKKDQVVMCGYNCKKKHEHLIGTYEQAMKYFTGSTEVANNSNHYGDLINIIIAHQLNDKFNIKTSSELYSILMRNAATKKYWIAEEKREEHILKLLKIAKEKHLIFDKEIIESLKKKGDSIKPYQRKRIYYQENFEKSLEDKGFTL